jgi:hypothetical protein
MSSRSSGVREIRRSIGPVAVAQKETAGRSPRDVEHFRVLSENAARA